ncbi:hypothetical protein FQN54_003259 [Arachnomyces sp. PD_36]|nr:hypothetical protein FQN54_003259 [Arachnomyces sp. PD_36]
MGGIFSSVKELPSADSPNLVLVHPTPAERIECLKANGVAWKGPLTFEQYIQREDYLRKQQRSKDGNLTLWILVDGSLQPDNRTILSACETLKKPAFVAHDGELEEVYTQGVGSVYCKPEYRSRGYAKRMLNELVKEIETWQQENEKRKKCVFSILYSDIGKNFYAQFGWKAFPSAQISFPPLPPGSDARNDLPAVEDMTADDVKSSMCSKAVIDRYRNILKEASVNSTPKIGVVPESTHMDLHWARENFYASKLWPDGYPPTVKGASVDAQNVYCTWTRTFGATPANYTLHILRLLNDDPSTPAEKEETIKAIAAVLRRAQYEAHKWEMQTVEIWNPTPLVQEAAKLLDANAEVVERERSSIPCLKWDGAEMGMGDDVEWFWNEKYSWC